MFKLSTLTPTFPTELVDQILGFLHSDRDYDTLKTCSDIFPQLVDRHLYSQISICEDDTINNEGTYTVDHNDFSLMLLDRPHIANYVRRIRVFMSGRCAFEQAQVSSILSNLSQIESIALSAYRHSWNNLDPMFRTAIQNSIRLPSVKEVEIRFFDSFPLDVFDNCKNLRRLVLVGECTGGETVAELPRLRSLGVEIQRDMKK